MIVHHLGTLTLFCIKTAIFQKEENYVEVMRFLLLLCCAEESAEHLLLRAWSEEARFKLSGGVFEDQPLFGDWIQTCIR